MKRQNRRILLGCSLGLMLAAVVLWARGLGLTEELVICWMGIANSRDITLIGMLYDAQLSFESHAHRPPFELRSLLPTTFSNERAIGLIIPHWMIFTIGCVYPLMAWWRHRSRKGAGFPVEVGTTDEHG